MPNLINSTQRKSGFHEAMARTKSAPTPASEKAASTPAPAPAASPADRPATDTSAPPRVLHPPKKSAPAAKKSLNFQDFLNDANSSGDDSDDRGAGADENPRARKLQKQRMLETMPVMNLGSQAFAPIGEGRPKTPPTPGAQALAVYNATELVRRNGQALADAMDEDAVSPADPPALSAQDIFGSSDDEGGARQEPTTWGGGCLFPKTCTKEYHMDNDPKGNDPVDNDPCTERLAGPDPTPDKEPCRLMPKNYKKKPPMHSGSVYNATGLVRRHSFVARNQSPQPTCSSQSENPQRSGLSPSDDEDAV